MFNFIKKLQQRYILSQHEIPDELWQTTTSKLALVSSLNPSEQQRLKEITTLFLYSKNFNPVNGFQLTEARKLIIAVQACILIRNLDLSYYDGWVDIVIYPDTFVVKREVTDQNGLVHKTSRPLSGESWSRGPVILSWHDIQLDSFTSRPGHNIIVHEFSHKLDMLNGRANGMPPLHPDMNRQDWTDSLSEAYDHLVQQLESFDHGYINEYAATNPAEFFAVISEYFFTAPKLLKKHCSDVYHQLILFYKQNP